MPYYIQKHTQQLLTILVYLPFIWLGTGLCLVDNGRSIMTRIIILSIIALIIKYKNKSWLLIYKTKRQIYTCLAMLAFIIYISTLQFYQPTNQMLAQSMGLICIYYYLFPTEKFDHRWLVLTSILSFISIGILIYINAYINNVPRLTYGHGMKNPIPVATFLMLMSINQGYCITIVKNKLLKTILILATITSITGVLLTNTRGVVLALIVLFIFLLVTSSKIQFKKSFIILITTITLISSALYPIVSKNVSQRYLQTKYEVKKIESGNLDTSIGLRIQMWKSGLTTIGDSPFIGIGNEDYKSEYKKHYNLGIVSKAFINYSPIHYHNVFIDISVRYGLIGLILFMSIFIFHIKKYNSKYPSRISFIYIITIFVCGLSDVPYLHLPVLFSFLILLFFSGSPKKT